MYVVTVEFATKPDALEAFRRLVIAQAHNSLDREPDCHQFDVCADPAEPTKIFLYEVYTDKAAFDAHLASDHFKSFSARTGDMVESKRVTLYDRIDP